jgi:hypothetical protein
MREAKWWGDGIYYLCKRDTAHKIRKGYYLIPKLEEIEKSKRFLCCCWVVPGQVRHICVEVEPGMLLSTLFCDSAHR